MLYSDYHRELAWDSWLKNKANGVTDRTDLVLILIAFNLVILVSMVI